MKKLSKTISTVLIAAISIAPLYAIGKIPFDNSPLRWEIDCEETEHEGGCYTVAIMNLAGKWKNPNTHKFVKIKGTRKERKAKAVKFFSFACSTGHETACESLSRIKKGTLKAK